MEYKTPAALADQAAAAPRYRFPRWAVVASIVAGIAAGVMRWWTADWYAYVDGRPKFELPLWFQFAESIVAGLLLTAALLIAVRLIHQVIRKTRRD